MQIPYEVQARPDTGLYNAKLGIWLFLASEVMLFGGLFSAFIFLRLGADDGYWPQGLLNVPIGTFNTIILILSSVTVIRAWVALKMRRFSEYKKWMAITIVCGAAFLVIKLTLEWPTKFSHFGAILHKDRWGKYEEFLGNEGLKQRGRPPRNEISGHLHMFTANIVDVDQTELDKIIKDRHLHVKKSEHEPNVLEVESHSPSDAEAIAKAPGKIMNPEEPDPLKRVRKVPGVKMLEFEVKADAWNADPNNTHYDRANFIPPKESDKLVKIHAEDIQHWSAFVPKHSTYFSTYFMITGLHGAHVLGGVLVFCFLWGPGAALYKKNPEHLANRVEVAGLFWHFVDLVWIFVFPLFYLL